MIDGYFFSSLVYNKMFLKQGLRINDMNTGTDCAMNSFINSDYRGVMNELKLYWFILEAN